MPVRRLDEEGFGLVEVIIAFFLLAIISVALLPALWNGVIQSSTQATTASATRFLYAVVEEGRESATTAGGASAWCASIGSKAAKAPASFTATVVCLHAGLKLTGDADSYRDQQRVRPEAPGHRHREGLRPMSAGREDDGASLIELIIYVVVLGLLMTGVSMMFLNMWATQEHVDARTQATTHGQLVSSEVEKAMRNATGFKVIDAGSTLLVQTSFSGAQKCQAFHFDPAGGVDGQGTLHMVLASAPAPAPSAGYAWQDGISPHTDVVFSKLFTGVGASGSPVATDAGRGALQLRCEGVRPRHRNRPGRVHRHGFCSQLDSREHHDMLALALKQRSRGHDGRAAGDDAGVALVVVLILMFLGAIAASAVAMMVVTTIQSTSSNKVATQEYVAAESGRDAAVATVAQGIKAGDGTLACSSGITVAPGGSLDLRLRRDCSMGDGRPNRRRRGRPSRVARTRIPPCPTASSNYVVIHATGTVPGGNTSETDSAYAWSLQPDTRPAGTLAYFDGQFTATKSTYEGDLVIRGTDELQVQQRCRQCPQGRPVGDQRERGDHRRLLHHGQHLRVRIR